MIAVRQRIIRLIGATHAAFLQTRPTNYGSSAPLCCLAHAMSTWEWALLKRFWPWSCEQEQQNLLENIPAQDWLQHPGPLPDSFNMNPYGPHFGLAGECEVDGSNGESNGPTTLHIYASMNSLQPWTTIARPVPVKRVRILLCSLSLDSQALKVAFSNLHGETLWVCRLAPDADLTTMADISAAAFAHPGPSRWRRTPGMKVEILLEGHAKIMPPDTTIWTQEAAKKRPKRRIRKKTNLANVRLLKWLRHLRGGETPKDLRTADLD